MDTTTNGYVDGGGGALLHSEPREFWTNACIAALLQEYEKVYLRAGRGHLKAKEWEVIAAEVNRVTQSSTRWTPDHCKAKLEGLKKYYRRERLKTLAYPSRWIFYDSLARLLDRTPTPTPTPTLNAPEMDFQNRISDPTGLQSVAYLPGDAMDESFQQFAKDSPQNGPTPDQFEDRRMDAGMAMPQVVSVMKTSPPLADNDDGNSSRKARPPRKKRGGGGDASSSVGRDIKEGLTNFAAVIEKIERTKMDLALSLQRQRMEQERRHAEMEVERTKMIMNNQLKLAKLLCAHSSKARKRRRTWEESVVVEEFNKEEEEGLIMEPQDVNVMQSSFLEVKEVVDEMRSGGGGVGPSAFRGDGFVDEEGQQSYQVSGDLDGSQSFRADDSPHIETITRGGGGQDVPDWADRMGVMWRSGCHDLNCTANNGGPILDAGMQGDIKMESEVDERIVR